MKLIVDKKQRMAKMRAHTAAHLLHAELGKIISGTKQAGSYVDEDYLRFDFSSTKALTENEIKEIESSINKIIYEGYEVVKEEMSFDDAIKLGAKAFFEDKYGEKVRVITIKNSDLSKFISLELCGGTHANNTADLGAFKIVGQESVASGIRRLTAFTGTKVFEYLNEKESLLDSIGEKIGAENHKQINDKIEKVLKDTAEMRASYESIQTYIIGENLKNIAVSAKSDEDFDLIISLNEGMGNFDFKAIVSKAREIFPEKNVIIFNQGGSVAIFTRIGTSSKAIAQKHSIKGGGSDSLFQGKDESVVNKFK